MAHLFYVVAIWPESETRMPTLALLDVLQMMRSLYAASWTEQEIAALLDELDAHEFAELDRTMWAWTERN